MTFTEAMQLDPAIRVYLGLALLATVYVACRVLNVFAPWAWRRLTVPFYRWRTRRLLRKFEREDAERTERRRREATGETLIDELRTQYDGLRPFPRRR